MIAGATKSAVIVGIEMIRSVARSSP